MSTADQVDAPLGDDRLGDDPLGDDPLGDWGPVRVKVCCVQSRGEAELAARLGADAIGLVGPMPSGMGVITLERIAEIARSAPPDLATFLLTSETSAPGILAQQRQARAAVIQLVDHPRPGTHAALREALPGVRLVQVVHVTGAESLEEAEQHLAAGVDALLLDSGNPQAAVKELGGTGRVHDWALSRRIRDRAAEQSVPVFLAGGLGPDNVAAAVAAVRPYGVDVCSRLRNNQAGALSAELTARFIAAARGGV